MANIVVGDIQFKSKDQKMSEPIEKIGEVGIGSDYKSGQVYWFKCWKVKRANLSAGLVSKRVK